MERDCQHEGKVNREFEVRAHGVAVTAEEGASFVEISCGERVEDKGSRTVAKLVN